LLGAVRTWATVVLLISSTPAIAETASYYGGRHHGGKTASGERFNQHAFTAAHRTLPFGSKVRVSHAGRNVVVRITDRGPFVKGRSIDLSLAAARQLGMIGKGVATVTISKF
jgi:rare lipoprotein A